MIHVKIEAQNRRNAPKLIFRLSDKLLSDLAADHPATATKLLLQAYGKASDGLVLALGANGVRSDKQNESSVSNEAIFASRHFGFADDAGKRAVLVRLERRGRIMVAVLPRLPDMAGPVEVTRMPAWREPAEAEFKALTETSAPRLVKAEPDAKPAYDPKAEQPPVTYLPPATRVASAPAKQRDVFNSALPAHHVFGKKPETPPTEEDAPWRARMRKWESEQKPPEAAKPTNGTHHAPKAPILTQTVTATPPALHDSKYSQPVDPEIRNNVLAAVELLNSYLDQDKSGLIVLRLKRNRIVAQRATIALADL